VLHRVLDGIDAALLAGLRPVKLNAVVVRGVNDDEVVELAEFGRERGVHVRYIEFMPLDADGSWAADQVVPAAEIVAAVGARWPLAPVERGPEPAHRWRYLDGRGEVGVIPSVTEPFCERCDRLRLTADGQLRSCLFSVDDHDLRGPLRSGASDDELSAAIEACVGAKWRGHAINQVQFVRPRRSMSQIGG
jgi:cyclic pyranopterin phosphate synthase